MLDRGPAVFHLVDDGLECCIVQKHAVFGVRNNIFELVFEQARVHRVEHPAHPRDTVPAHKVARVVHGKACHAFTRLDTQSFQGLRHFKSVAADASPVSACFATIGPARNNLSCPGFSSCLIDHMGDPHRPILHRSKCLRGHLYLSPRMPSYPTPRAFMQRIMPRASTLGNCHIAIFEKCRRVQKGPENSGPSLIDL